MYAPVLYRWKQTYQIGEEEERRKNMKELREWRGVRPSEIAEWEQSVEALEEFWVYLPDFLGGDEKLADQIIDVMASNLQKNTRYMYIVENRDDVMRLLKLVRRLMRHDGVRDRNVEAMVSVLVLRGSGDNGVAQAVSGLHLGNCWIANPRTERAEGYEVAFDEHGTEPVGRRKLPVNKLHRIIRNVAAIIDVFPPPTFEGVESDADIMRLIDRSPQIAIERPRTGVPSDTIVGTAERAALSSWMNLRTRVLSRDQHPPVPRRPHPETRPDPPNWRVNASECMITKMASPLLTQLLKCWMIAATLSTSSALTRRFAAVMLAGTFMVARTVVSTEISIRLMRRTVERSAP